MLKKILIFFVVLYCTISNALCANYTDCNTAMSARQPFLLYIHTNTCGSCKEFTPIFSSIADSLSYNVVDINFSYPQQNNICTTAETKTVPALYVVNPTARTRSKVNIHAYSTPEELKQALINLLQ